MPMRAKTKFTFAPAKKSKEKDVHKEEPSSSTTSRLGFFDLPPEIRWMIYEYCGFRRRKISPPDNVFMDPPFDHIEGPAMGLLAANTCIGCEIVSSWKPPVFSMEHSPWCLEPDEEGADSFRSAAMMTALCSPINLELQYIWLGCVGILQVMLECEDTRERSDVSPNVFSHEQIGRQRIRTSNSLTAEEKRTEDRTQLDELCTLLASSIKRRGGHGFGLDEFQLLRKGKVVQESPRVRWSIFYS